LKQLFVIVHVTVVVPPQAAGAVGFVGFLVNVPPLLVTEPSQFVNAVLIASEVVQAASVVLCGQFKVTGVCAVTVNVALQVFGPSHALVTVNVTVLEPPQALGADPPLLVTGPRAHPPLAVAVASQSAYS
jgi:hypothetical protein